MRQHSSAKQADIEREVQRRRNLAIEAARSKKTGASKPLPKTE